MFYHIKCLLLGFSVVVLGVGCQDSIRSDEEVGGWSVGEDVSLDDRANAFPEGSQENMDQRLSDEIGRNPDDPNVSRPGYEVPPNSHCEMMTTGVEGELLAKVDMRYDDEGRLSSFEDDDEHVEYFYNDWGGRSRDVSSSGCVTTYSYHENHLLEAIEQVCEDGSGEDWRYTYDEHERLVQACQVTRRDDGRSLRELCGAYTYPTPRSRFYYHYMFSPDAVFEEVYFLEDGRRDKLVYHHELWSGPDNVHNYIYDDALRLIDLQPEDLESTTYTLVYDESGRLERAYPWGTTTRSLDDYVQHLGYLLTHADFTYNRAGEARRIDFFDIHDTFHGSIQLEGKACRRSPLDWFQFVKMAGTDIYRNDLY